MDFWPCLLAAGGGLLRLAAGAANALEAPEGLPKAPCKGPAGVAGPFRFGARPCRDWLWALPACIAAFY